MANSHPGSYCGQDAYSDMLVTDDGMVHRKRSIRSITSQEACGCAKLHARSTNNFEGGGDEMRDVSECKTIVRRLTPL